MPRWIRRLLPRKGDSASGREAQAALERATEDLRHTREHAAEVDRAVAKLREIRQRNHFAELFDQVLRGGG